MEAFQDAGRRNDSGRSMETARQDIIDRLTEAFAADVITMEEYERRASVASSATRLDELDRLSLDLPSKSRAAPKPDTGRSYARRGDSSIVGAAPMTTGCVMGDRNLTGNWLSSDRVSAFTVMGSTKLDLRDVDLPLGPVKIEAFTLMGDTKIIVPRGLPVRLNVFAFMGESRSGREVNQQIKGADTWVEVSGFAMMGSVTVRALD